MTIHGKIEGKIAERGYTNADLCKLIEVKESTLMKYKRQIKAGDYSNLSKFCDALGFEIKIKEKK